MPDTEPVRVRLTYSTYSGLVAFLAVAAFMHVFWPWYALLGFVLFAAIEFARIVVQRAAWIAFDETGIDVGLFLRTRRIPGPVAEFSASRMRGVSVRDLRTGKSYLLTTMRRARRIVAAAEARGYAVLDRPTRTVD